VAGTPIPVNAAAFTVEELARATGGVETRRGVPRASGVSGVVTDSRLVRRGCLFVALRGATFDGHDFVERAIEGGAGAVVVEHGRRVGGDVTVIEVEDTTRALGDLARFHRRRWGGTIVAITGSVGKTSTKELTAAALGADGARVLRTAGNLNNLIGVPMTLFGLDGTVDCAVVELGTSAPGEIRRLAEIAEPNVGVVTVVAPAHTEGLGSVEQVAREKTDLLRAVPPTGLVVYSADDGLVEPALRGLTAMRRLSFGVSPRADVRLLSHDVDAAHGTVCTFAIAGRAEPVPVRLSLLGRAAALNAAAALAIATGLGVDLSLAADALATVSPIKGRMRVLSGPDGSTVIDDTYNANPRSMQLAIETAYELGGPDRVVVVAGDMKELGSISHEEHRRVGIQAAALPLRAFVGCGVEMRHAVDAARDAGAAFPLHHVDDADRARPVARSLLRPGDVLLVKGSRSMQMERLVEAFVEEPEVVA
jgi:UDP-N-acetylmuramoyl-tripeptide--D-alanyl-D-alanine ligase